MRLILTRHGQTIDNQLHILQGQTPGKLSKVGISQSSKLAEFLSSFDIDICFTSDLKRAVDTANIIASNRVGMRVEKDARLRERYLGRLQGKPIPHNWDGMGYYEGAESVEELIERVNSFLAHIRENYKEKTILIVSHGITLKVILWVCLQSKGADINQIEELQNCSINILEKLSEDLPFNLIKINNSFLFR